MSSPLRAGLIGLGMMGRHHARVLRDLDGVRLIAAADPAGDLHNAVGDIPVLTETEDLLRRYRPDYCVLAVNTAQHLPVGSTLAAEGVPTLIEKPLAPTSTEAMALADAFEAAGVIAAVGQTERYNPAVQALRTRLEDGQLGSLFQVATRRQSPFPDRVGDVGVVKDLATHDIDLVAFATSLPVTSVSAYTTSRTGRQHEDLVVAVGELTDGTITSHMVNWLSPFKERITMATGERGCLIADTVHGDLTYHENGSVTTSWPAAEIFRGVSEGDVIRYAIAKREPLRTEHEAFRDALLGRSSHLVTLQEAATTVAVADALLASARSGNSAVPRSLLLSHVPHARQADRYHVASMPSSR